MEVVEWITLETARQALSKMRVARVHDPSMLKEIEAFISRLGSGTVNGDPV